MAIKIGAHVENNCGSCASPSVRRTNAPPREWPELTMLRMSLSSLPNESNSSISKVGDQASIDRNSEAAVTLETAIGL